MNYLLVELMDLNIGALVGKINTCALAYCDDILLMSQNEGHLQTLLSTCANYALK